MHKNTVDFTTLRPNVYRGDWSLDQFIPVRRALRLEYFKQRSISDEAFKKKIVDANSEIIDRFEDFISKSITIHERPCSFFDVEMAHIIHAAKLIFGLQSNDNELTIRQLEDHTRGVHPEVHVERIGPMSKYTNLVAALERHKHTTHFLLIIQQVELFEQQMIRRLIALLHSRSRCGGNSMILFCTSDKSTKLPLQNIGYLGKIVEIYRAKDKVDLSVAESLLIGENSKFKIGGQLIDTIDENVTCFEPSIMNYRYLYQYSMFEHYCKISSVFSSERAVLKSLLRQQPNLIGNLLLLGSMKEKQIVQDLKKSTNVVESVTVVCDDLVADLLNMHKYTCDQLICYFELIVDESKAGKFASLLDLYEELIKYDDLGQSVEFLEKIRGLSKYATDRLIKRIDRAKNIRSQKSSGHISKEKDVLDILNFYRDKLMNNDSCDKIKNSLVDDLLKHCQSITNPTRKELNEAIYYTDHRMISSRCIPYTRNSRYWFEGCCKDLALLSSTIRESPEEMSLLDLFDEFSAFRTKITNGNSDDLDATIFMDLINDLEYQGLIKRDGKGRLKKLVWF